MSNLINSVMEEKGDRMSHIERRKEILNTIMSKGSVKVAELSGKFRVGEATIRRDLKYLAKEYGIESGSVSPF